MLKLARIQFLKRSLKFSRAIKGREDFEGFDARAWADEVKVLVDPKLAWVTIEDLKSGEVILVPNEGVEFVRYVKVDETAKSER